MSLDLLCFFNSGLLLHRPTDARLRFGTDCATLDAFAFEL